MNVVHLLAGNVVVPVREVRRNAQGQITQVKQQKHWPYVKHFYYYSAVGLFSEFRNQG